MTKVLWLLVSLLIVSEVTVWFYLIPTVDSNSLKRDTAIFRYLGDQYFDLKDQVEDLKTKFNNRMHK